MSHKHFCMMGSTLIRFLVSEQTAGLLCWLQLTAPRTSMGGLRGFATDTFPVPVGGTRDFCRYLNAAPRETKNNISKEITLNFSVTLVCFFFSQWRIFIMKGLLFSSLSLLCVLYVCTTHLWSRTCFVFWADFCLETSAILFSLVGIVRAILKDQLKYNFEKISAS